MSTIEQFYSAFQERDWATMGACYHPEAHFSDPVFPDLDANGVKAMWKMLLSSGPDLRIEFEVLEENATGGTVEWDAYYTFSASGRKVHNAVTSKFVFKAGSVIEQVDVFNFWRWSRQALGLKGTLLGWTPLMRNKVQRTAASRLAKAMRE
ncbi:MAG: nuclear transport factor 2 family protein [Flavobacteriales bacterium]